MRTRRTVSFKMTVASLLVFAAGALVACRLGKNDELEDRALPEPLPVVDAGKAAATTPAATSPGAAPATRPATAEPRTPPNQPGPAQPAPTTQASASPSPSATTAEATSTKPAEAGAPAPATATVPTVTVPAQMTKCADKCQAVLSTCLKRLSQPDAGVPSANTLSSCAEAEAKCRTACL